MNSERVFEIAHKDALSLKFHTTFLLRRHERKQAELTVRRLTASEDVFFAGTSASTSLGSSTSLRYGVRLYQVAQNQTREVEIETPRTHLIQPGGYVHAAFPRSLHSDDRLDSEGRIRIQPHIKHLTSHSYVVHSSQQPSRGSLTSPPPPL